jgi:hypothetical protein
VLVTELLLQIVSAHSVNMMVVAQCVMTVVLNIVLLVMVLVITVMIMLVLTTEFNLMVMDYVSVLMDSMITPKEKKLNVKNVTIDVPLVVILKLVLPVNT